MLWKFKKKTLPWPINIEAPLQFSPGRDVSMPYFSPALWSSPAASWACSPCAADGPLSHCIAESSPPQAQLLSSTTGSQDPQAAALAGHAVRWGTAHQMHWHAAAAAGGEGYSFNHILQHDGIISECEESVCKKMFSDSVHRWCWVRHYASLSVRAWMLHFYTRICICLCLFTSLVLGLKYGLITLCGHSASHVEDHMPFSHNLAFKSSL